MSQVLEIGNPFLNEVAWNGIHLHAQQILYLRSEDGDGDTAGETNDDGVGNVLDDGTQAQQAETDKENTRHECGDGETLYAILVDDASHDDNKSTRRAEMAKPATIAVIIPFSGETPLAIPKAIANGRATIPTIRPAIRSAVNVCLL